MGRRNEHTREELREIALQAAEHLVAEHGLAGLSTRKVVGRIGYTVGSLYMVFRNLDDLIAQMNERTLETLQARLIAAIADQPPAAAIRALARTYITFALADTHRWLAIYEHRMPEDQPLPESFTDKVARHVRTGAATTGAALPPSFPGGHRPGRPRAVERGSRHLHSGLRSETGNGGRATDPGRDRLAAGSLSGGVHSTVTATSGRPARQTSGTTSGAG